MTTVDISPATGPGKPSEHVRAGLGGCRNGAESPEFEDVGEEYLAEAVVRLIRDNPSVRRAILGVVMSCPNVRTET